MQTESKEGRRERPRHRWTKQVSRGLRNYRTYLIVVAIIALLSAGYLLARSRRGPHLSQEQMVVEASRAAVRMSVRKDLRTSFSSEAETHLERLPADKFQVNGWVDLIPASVAIERHAYSCIIYQTEGGNWAADNLAIVPQ